VAENGAPVDLKGWTSDTFAQPRNKKKEIMRTVAAEVLKAYDTIMVVLGLEFVIIIILP
jgi:hypothetical protein